MAIANDIDVTRSHVATGELEWARVSSLAKSARLTEFASRPVLEASALLLRVARSDSSGDAQAAARWLEHMGFALAIAVGANESLQQLIRGGMGAMAPMVTKVVDS